MTVPEIYDVQADTESPVASMLTHLICSLVDHPDRVLIYGVGSGDEIEFVAELEPFDLSKFCGRNARTAESLRVVVRAIGSKNQSKFSLSFTERPSKPPLDSDP